MKNKNYKTIDMKNKDYKTLEFLKKYVNIAKRYKDLYENFLSYKQFAMYLDIDEDLLYEIISEFNLPKLQTPEEMLEAFKEKQEKRKVHEVIEKISSSCSGNDTNMGTFIIDNIKQTPIVKEYHFYDNSKPDVTKPDVSVIDYLLLQSQYDKSKRETLSKLIEDYKDNIKGSKSLDGTEVSIDDKKYILKKLRKF